MLPELQLKLLGSEIFHRAGAYKPQTFLPELELELRVLITSLLRRLQAQILPNATPPIGKIHPFSKSDFDALRDLESS